jgi:hypothetical protein
MAGAALGGITGVGIHEFQVEFHEFLPVYFIYWRLIFHIFIIQIIQAIST